MKLTCPHCQCSLTVSHHVRGKDVRCPVCQWKFVAPSSPGKSNLGRQMSAGSPSSTPNMAGRPPLRAATASGKRPPLATIAVVSLCGMLLVGGILAFGRVPFAASIASYRADRALTAAKKWLAHPEPAYSESVRQQLASVLDSPASVDQKGEARSVLQQLAERDRSHRAEELWENIRTAIAAADASSAVKLLEEYLRHPFAANKGAASDLLQQCMQATSDAEAARVLAGLGESDLKVFQETGELPAGRGPAEPSLAAIFQHRLRKHLGKEIAQREILLLARKSPEIEQPEIKQPPQKVAEKEATQPAPRPQSVENTTPTPTASLAGKIKLDGVVQPQSTTVRLYAKAVPAAAGGNGRRKPPEPILVTVGKDGDFSASDLLPTEYRVQVTADKHVPRLFIRTLESGRQVDLGTVRLFSTDLSLYVGKPAPHHPDAVWEQDYKTALRRAVSEQKPILIMMTATWCGYCKLLEKETFAEPWIHHFLDSFVLLKAYEDKEVERTYGAAGYPTLVFANSQGKLAYKSVGFKHTLPFCLECQKAFEQLRLELPPELEMLAEMQTLSVNSAEAR